MLSYGCRVWDGCTQQGKGFVGAAGYGIRKAVCLLKDMQNLLQLFAAACILTRYLFSWQDQVQCKAGGAKSSISNNLESHSN